MEYLIASLALGKGVEKAAENGILTGVMLVLTRYEKNKNIHL